MKRLKRLACIFVVVTSVVSVSSYGLAGQSGKSTAGLAMASAGMLIAVGASNAVVAAKFSAICSAKWISCPIMVPMAVVSLVAAGMYISQSGKAKQTAAGAVNGGPIAPGDDFNLCQQAPELCSTPGGGPLGPDPNKIGGQISKGLDDACKKGYCYDKDKNTITNPDGGVMDASAFSSGDPAQIAAATGMSQDGVEAALAAGKKATADIASKFKLGDVNMTASTGSGGGGSAGGQATNASKFDYGSLFGQKRKPAESKVAGLQKMVGGQPVGIAQDNLFEMVNRRYETKIKSNFFQTGP